MIIIYCFCCCISTIRQPVVHFLMLIVRFYPDKFAKKKWLSKKVEKKVFKLNKRKFYPSNFHIILHEREICIAPKFNLPSWINILRGKIERNPELLLWIIELHSANMINITRFLLEQTPRQKRREKMKSACLSYKEKEFGWVSANVFVRRATSEKQS